MVKAAGFDTVAAVALPTFIVRMQFIARSI
jgi:hypothetical protein